MIKKAVFFLSAVGAIATSQAVSAQQVQVTIESLVPTGGVGFTPVWVGFHNGSFDSYNGGLSSQPGLELIAEAGITSLISSDFANNLTYIDNSGASPVSATLDAASAGLAQTGTRIQGTLGSGPITSGNSVTQTFDLSFSEDNQYFSYASMILPSNDYYIANGNAFAHDLSGLFDRSTDEISFNIGLAGFVNDAGTEVNDFTTSAGNGLFPGLPPGQSSPDEGAPQNGVNTNVSDPFGNFLNTPGGLDLSLLNFNDTTLYPEGIARVTITRVETVPESSNLLGLLGLGLMGATAVRHKLKLNAINRD